jgi:transcriptional regulator with XRE-family HTH domain
VICGLHGLLAVSQAGKAEDMQLTLSPDVAAQVVKYWITRYRKIAGKSQVEAAKRVGIKQPTMAGFESGNHLPSQAHLELLLDFYGKRDQFEKLRIVREVAARRGGRTDGVPISTVEAVGLRYGLELFAVSIEEYAPDLVGGLLQIEDYAREIITTYADLVPGEDPEQSLRTRMDRQRVLRREDGEEPLTLTMYVEEQVLSRPIGGASALVKQLDYLLEMSKLRNVTVRVVSRKVAYHPALQRPFSLLSFEDEWRVAYAEDFQSAHYYDTPAALERAARLMGSLHHVALDQARSRRRISEIRKELM